MWYYIYFVMLYLKFFKPLLLFFLIMNSFKWKTKIWTIHLTVGLNISLEEMYPSFLYPKRGLSEGVHLKIYLKIVTTISSSDNSGTKFNTMNPHLCGFSGKAPKSCLKCTPFVVPRMVWNWSGTFENTCKNMEHFM